MSQKLKLSLSLLAIIATTLLIKDVYATQEPKTPPDFPACLSFTEPGDLTHYDSGSHQIVGNGLLQGTDDVYTLGDNFIQCFCSPQGEGIQTNWWRNDGNLEGWFSENGLQWNLGDFNYLAQNIDYDCSEPEPTPAPTGTPSNGNGGGNGNGHYSCPASKPSTPSLDNVVRKSPISVELIWKKVDGVSHYTISYGTQPDNHPYGVPDTGNVTAFVINDLEPNQTYYFKIYAVNDCQPSEASNEMTPISTGGQVLGATTTDLPETGSSIVQELIVSLMGSISLYSLFLSLKAKKNSKKIKDHQVIFSRS